MSGIKVVKSGTLGQGTPNPGDEPDSSAHCTGARPTLAARSNRARCDNNSAAGRVREPSRAQGFTHDPDLLPV